MSEPTATKVAVIGTGLMGSAIAKVLLERGHVVSVWNRTADRTDAAVRLGASATGTVAEAVEASDLVIVVLGSIAHVHEYFADLDLTGKDVVSVVSGSPSAVGELDVMLRGRGAAFIDGAIQGFPDAIGSAEIKTFYSGDPQMWNRREDLLRQLGGASVFVGEAAGAAKTMNSAWVAGFFCTAISGFHEVMAFAQSQGIDAGAMEDSIDYALTMLGASMRSSAEAIRSGRFESTQAELVAFLEGVNGAHEAMTGAGMPADFVSTTKRTLERAVRQGHGKQGIAAQYLVLNAGQPNDQ